MTRKDSEKDSERPHYYSQFWLDVAAGRRVIGAPKPNDDTEQNEGEIPELNTPYRIEEEEREDGLTAPAAAKNGRSEAIEHPVVEPLSDEVEFVEPESDDLITVDDQDVPEDDLEDTDIPDMDLTPLDEDDEDFFEEEEGEEGEEEDEDDLGWSGRGRKRSKPTKITKQPPRVNKPKREPRRGY